VINKEDGKRNHRTEIKENEGNAKVTQEIKQVKCRLKKRGQVIVEN
jgi:hypothetical protein